MSNRPELRLEERLRGVNHSQRKPTPTLSRKPSNDSNVGMLTHSATLRRGNDQVSGEFPQILSLLSAILNKRRKMGSQR